MVVITETSGSTPRKAGARMLVHPDGRTTGTIGGGWIEAEATRLALELAAGTDVPKIARFDMRGSDAAMLCGGSVELLFQRIEEE